MSPRARFRIDQPTYAGASEPAALRRFRPFGTRDRTTSRAGGESQERAKTR
jgi:hypothetical protein